MENCDEFRKKHHLSTGGAQAAEPSVQNRMAEDFDEADIDAYKNLIHPLQGSTATKTGISLADGMTALLERSRALDVYKTLVLKAVGDDDVANSLAKNENTGRKKSHREARKRMQTLHQAAYPGSNVTWTNEEPRPRNSQRQSIQGWHLTGFHVAITPESGSGFSGGVIGREEDDESATDARTPESHGTPESGHSRTRSGAEWRS